MTEGETEILTLIVSDDRWRRAASLPFTREIRRVGGSSADFTVTRAAQLDKTDLAGIRHRIRQFAADAKVRFAFETLSEHETARLRDLLSREDDVLIAPSSLKGRPIYKYIATLKCRITLVEIAEPGPQRRHESGLR